MFKYITLNWNLDLNLICNERSVQCSWEVLKALSPSFSKLIEANSSNNMKEYHVKNLCSEIGDIEFDMLCSIFRGEKIIYSESNYQKIDNLATIFHIDSLKYSIDRFHDYIDIYEDNYEVSYEIVDELLLCELYLLELEKIDINELDDLNKNQLFEDTVRSSERFVDTITLESFVEQIFNCIISRPKKIEIYLKFVETLSFQREFALNALRHMKLELCFPFGFTGENNIYEICYLLRYFLMSGYLTKEEIHYNDGHRYPMYFHNLSSCLDYIDNDNEGMNKIDSSGELDEELHQNRFCEIIANDDIEQLQKESCDQFFDSRSLIRKEAYERIDFVNNESVSLIDYAAFHSAIKCFKFLLLNNADISDNTLKYAVAGGNIEIIRICEQKNKDSMTLDCLKTAITFKNYEVFKWIIETKNIIYEPKKMINHCVLHSCFRCLYYFLQQNEFNMDCAICSIFLSNCANLVSLIRNYSNTGQGHILTTSMYINNNIYFLEKILNKNFNIRYFNSSALDYIPKSHFKEVISLIYESIPVRQTQPKKNKNNINNKPDSNVVNIAIQCIKIGEYDFFYSYLFPKISPSKYNYLLENVFPPKKKLSNFCSPSNTEEVKKIINMVSFVIEHGGNLIYSHFALACFFANLDFVIKCYNMPSIEKKRTEDHNSKMLCNALTGDNENVVYFLLEQEDTLIDENIIASTLAKMNSKLLNLLFAKCIEKNIKIKLTNQTMYLVFRKNIPVEFILQIIKSPAIDNTEDIEKNDTTMFLLACQHNFKEIFEYLYYLDEVNVNSIDKEGRNALALTTDPYIIDFLLKTRFNKNVKPNKEFIYKSDDIVKALRTSCFSNDFNVLFMKYRSYIFDENFMTDEQLNTIFSDACISSSLEIVKYMMYENSNNNENGPSDGTKINPKIDVNHIDDISKAPIIFSIILSNNKDMLELILSHPNIDLNTRAPNLFSNNGYIEDATLLSCAAAAGNLLAPELLLSKNDLIDINDTCIFNQNGGVFF